MNTHDIGRATTHADAPNDHDDAPDRLDDATELKAWLFGLALMAVIIVSLARTVIVVVRWLVTT